MKLTIEIEVPDGKKAVWKDNKVVFEDIKPQFPKTWKEFCQMNPIKNGEAYIDNSSSIIRETKKASDNRLNMTDKKYLPNINAARAHLTLMQLHQLRDCYRNGWLPNESVSAYVIERYYDSSIGAVLRVLKYYHPLKFLSFQTREIAYEFLTNFHELIEQAGDLI